MSPHILLDISGENVNAVRIHEAEIKDGWQEDHEENSTQDPVGATVEDQGSYSSNHL